MVVRENYKWNAPGRAVVLACVIGRAKTVAVSKLRDIAQVAYLGQIMNIGGGRVRKL